MGFIIFLLMSGFILGMDVTWKGPTFVASMLMDDGRGQREKTVCWKGRKNDNLVYERS